MKHTIDNYETYDSSELWISKPHDTKNKRYRRCQIYTNADKYNKLWIKTPFMYVPFNVSTRSTKNNKLYSLTCALNPLTTQRKKFIALIKSIDDIIVEKIGWYLGDEYIYCSSINQKDKKFFKHKITLNLPMNKDGGYGFLLYDKHKEKKTMEDIIPGSKMIGIIELFDIWIDDEEKKYSASWNVVHYKIFQDISIDDNYFIDLEDDSEVTVNKNLGVSKERYKVKCPNCEHKLDLTINLNIQGIIDKQKYSMPFYIPQAPSFDGIPCAPGGPPPPPLAPPFDKSCGSIAESRGFVPNLDDIMNIKKKLKKIVPVVKGSVNGKKQTSNIKKITGKKK